VLNIKLKGDSGGEQQLLCGQLTMSVLPKFVPTAAQQTSSMPFVVRTGRDVKKVYCCCLFMNTFFTFRFVYVTRCRLHWVMMMI
jgi:hypothetical protein